MEQEIHPPELNIKPLLKRLMPILPIFWMLLFPGLVVAQPRCATRGAPYVSSPGWWGPGFGYGYGPGLGWNYYNVPGGPYVGMWGWGGYPAAVGSFWTNGLSLYGPPVPTYGPVPGTFGAGDAHRFYMNPPIFGYGLNYFGYRSPSPRLSNPSVSVHPPGYAPIEVPSPRTLKCARVVVRVPQTDAELWVNLTTTKGKGIDRDFESPDLEEGKSYRYEMIARWVEGTEPKAESRVVMVRAGDRVSVDFTIPDTAAKAPKLAANPGE